MGTGILNWIFALPAFFTIDTFGRRFLLLVTFPFLCITLLWTGMSFFLPEHTTKRTAMITTGMYLYEVFYSPGMGPVPFSYSAESFPIQVHPSHHTINSPTDNHQVRDVGMASATAVLWAFNFILSFTWPALVDAFKPQGAFGWYAAWCGILWLLSKHSANHTPFTPTNNFTALLIFPETKELTLEELDAVFSVPTRRQVARGLREPWYWVNKYLLGRNVELPPLVDVSQLRGEQKREGVVGGV
jgi:MFS family permease